MKISVLMSVYNRDTASNLDIALESIWNKQIRKPDQIILVEDGLISKELTIVLNKWEDNLPSILKRIKLPTNVGLGKALNEGLKYCSNEWVFRMDADDICAPDRFLKQIRFIDENPDVDIFSSYIEEFSIYPDKSQGVKKVPLTHKDLIKFARWRSPFNHMAVAYKKTIIDSVGGYQHHLFMEDYNLWLRVLATNHKGGNLPDILVFVRAGDNMIKRRRGWEYIKSEWKLFELKKKLYFQNLFSNFAIFIFRSLLRLLPIYYLSKVYIILRKII